MTFDLVPGKTRDLGGFSVSRVLPSLAHRAVGPFVFFDHLGPATFEAGQAFDVRPHPHIGLATVTFLFDGEIIHRDSLGTVQAIRPGDVNWMTAGRGIVHSERSSDEARARRRAMHGIQSWVAVPVAHEDDAPSFAHHPAATLPVVERPGARIVVIAGTAFGRTSPVDVTMPTLYAAVAARCRRDAAGRRRPRRARGLRRRRERRARRRAGARRHDGRARVRRRVDARGARRGDGDAARRRDARRTARARMEFRREPPRSHRRGARRVDDATRTNASRRCRASTSSSRCRSVRGPNRPRCDD